MSNTRYLLIAVVFFLFCQISSGQNRKKDQDVAEALKGYFTLAPQANVRYNRMHSLVSLDNISSLESATDHR
jgi:hypothetical protein